MGNRDESIDCQECGQEELQEGPYYHCRGCGTYDICLTCASGESTTKSSESIAPGSVILSDSDDSDLEEFESHADNICDLDGIDLTGLDVDEDETFETPPSLETV